MNLWARIGLGLVGLALGLCGSSRELGGIAPSAPRLTHGVAVGDVTERSAVLWTRADGPAAVAFELSLDPDFRRVVWTGNTAVDERTDFIAQLDAQGLQPGTRYWVRARAERDGLRSEPAVGEFRTAPAPESDAPQSATLLWSSDLGGQGRCRRPEYAIFRAMREVGADLFLFLGDTIYADDVCPSPPNLPGSELNAALLGTLEAYRAKHRYNRADPPFLELLKQTPVVAIWDDHEVKNNFVGTRVDPELLELGRRALFEYYPIRRDPDDPHRLYRAFRWGRHLELIVLDTRQHRRPFETMLGAAQLRWLLERIERSDATWLLIASSVTLSIARSCPQCDGWGDGLPGAPTKFERELARIVDALRAHPRRNVVFLTGDVHFPRALSYDPDGDGALDFWEFTAGPLSAVPGGPWAPDPTFRPQELYAHSGLYTFGVLRVDEAGRLTVELRDLMGRVRFQTTLEPSPRS